MSEHEQEPTEELEQASAEGPSAPSEDAGAQEEGDGHAEEEEAAETPSEESVPETGALSEKDVEKRLNALQKEATRHANRVSEVMDADAQMLVPCPLCETIIPGFVMAGSLDEARRQTVRVFLGDREPENWQADPHSNRCESCDGYGEVLTGSRKAGQEVAHCVDCGGKGWTGDRVAAGYVPPAAVAPLTQENGETVTTLSPEDLAEVERLRAKGVVAMVPGAPPGQ